MGAILPVAGETINEPEVMSWSWCHHDPPAGLFVFFFVFIFIPFRERRPYGTVKDEEKDKET